MDDGKGLDLDTRVCLTESCERETRWYSVGVSTGTCRVGTYMHRVGHVLLTSPVGPGTTCIESCLHLHSCFLHLHVDLWRSRSIYAYKSSSTCASQREKSRSKTPYMRSLRRQRTALVLTVIFTLVFLIVRKSSISRRTSRPQAPLVRVKAKFTVK